LTPATASADVTKAAVEALLFREARLLDEWRLDEWLDMFTSDAMYWLPLDDGKPTDRNASIVFDTTVRREERVHHLLNHRFASQSPRSRTVHMIANVEVEAASENRVLARSNQVVYEVRTGDFRQTGLGRVRPLVARVEHLIEVQDGELKIAGKKILLIDRGMSQRNLTFIL
jgi:3-phenylpropionate/cinnamic acid dioxygenase small subunit